MRGSKVLNIKTGFLSAAFQSSILVIFDSRESLCWQILQREFWYRMAKRKLLPPCFRASLWGKVVLGCSFAKSEVSYCVRS